MSIIQNIQSILGSDDSELLLSHKCTTISKELVHLPSIKNIKINFGQSDRSQDVLNNIHTLFNHGRLGGTGYLSILPVDQAIEHSAGASFAKNPIYFDPENILKLAIEAGCSAVATTAGVLGMMSKTYADDIPFIVKLNHNDLLRFPNDYDQVMFSSVERAHNLGAIGVGATIYFGSKESKRQIREVEEAFEQAHKLGMFTVLWCYIRNEGFVVNGKDYHSSADLTAQANHLGVTIGADIIKQKLATTNGGYKAINKQTKFSKFDERMYTDLSSDHPIDLVRYQVANCYMGRIPLINSGGASGDNDLHDAVASAVINKRAGGSGLILGRKAFQKPLEEGIEILSAVQDVYLCDEIDIA